MLIPTPEALSRIDPKVRFSHMESDRPEEAWPNVRGEPLAAYGTVDYGSERTHNPREPEIVDVVTRTNVPEFDREIRLPSPVSYTMRDKLNTLIFPGGRASVRARQPKGMIFAKEQSNSGAPYPEEFRGGKAALTPRVAVAPYQYIGQNWESPQRVQRVEPELYSDQTPPATLQGGF